VRFHGGLDNEQLAALHRRSRLFLHGSIEEPFGMAPLEAIACNTPVIAHRSGGPLEFVNDSCGRLIDSLCEERWSEEISDFLSKLEDDPDYFKGVSENARKFSWESTLSPVIQLIADFAPGRR
jgi:D-inositol-3-phosphate glycosyltransferase